MIENLQKIIKSIEERKVEPFTGEITAATSLRDDLHFDSFDLAELTVRIEAEFGVDVFEDGIVYTVGEILKKLPDE
ncbi:MAG: acyl carrier protein [Candidatus Merdousia sp.]|nr:acyl carrier protein [Candidatus Merdousia sp.]